MHASAIHDELAELVRAGLTPTDALRSATIDPAPRDFDAITS
jgi:imidazolonepropionase-like amidohydrolase